MITVYISLLLLASFSWRGWAGATQAPANLNIDCRTYCEDKGDTVVFQDNLYRQIQMPFYFILFIEYQEKENNENTNNYVNLFELRGLDSDNNDHAFMSVPPPQI